MLPKTSAPNTVSIYSPPTNSSSSTPTLSNQIPAEIFERVLVPQLVKHCRVKDIWSLSFVCKELFKRCADAREPMLRAMHNQKELCWKKLAPAESQAQLDLHPALSAFCQRFLARSDSQYSSGVRVRSTVPLAPSQGTGQGVQEFIGSPLDQRLFAYSSLRATVKVMDSSYVGPNFFYLGASALVALQDAGVDLASDWFDCVDDHMPDPSPPCSAYQIFGHLAQAQTSPQLPKDMINLYAKFGMQALRTLPSGCDKTAAYFMRSAIDFRVALSDTAQRKNARAVQDLMNAVLENLHKLQSVHLQCKVLTIWCNRVPFWAVPKLNRLMQDQAQSGDELTRAAIARFGKDENWKGEHFSLLKVLTKIVVVGWKDNPAQSRKLMDIVVQALRIEDRAIMRHFDKRMRAAQTGKVEGQSSSEKDLLGLYFLFETSHRHVNLAWLSDLSDADDGNSSMRPAQSRFKWGVEDSDDSTDESPLMTQSPNESGRCAWPCDLV